MPRAEAGEMRFQCGRPHPVDETGQEGASAHRRLRGSIPKMHSVRRWVGAPAAQEMKRRTTQGGGLLRPWPASPRLGWSWVEGLAD